MFEGHILYTNRVISKIKNVSDQSLLNMIGNRQDYFAKGGNYKSVSNGKIITMQLYDNQSNKIYNQTPNSDTLYWIDASANTDEMISYEMKKNADTILGNVCDAIVITTKANTTTLYYSKKYTVDTRFYTSHKYGNWSFYLSKSGGALPLKTVIEYQQFVMESTATEIKAMQLNDHEFAIDSNVPVKKAG
jgi:hypothetical protein